MIVDADCHISTFRERKHIPADELLGMMDRAGAEEIAGTGKIIAFHCGADAYERTHPAQIAKIAGQYPEMQILCVHMGGVGVPDLSKAAIELARLHSNVTLIGSEINPTSVLKRSRHWERRESVSAAMRRSD